MSSAHEDYLRVVPVYNALVSAGFRTWWSEASLVPGLVAWENQLNRVIRDSDFFLAFLSEASASKHSFLQIEMDFALGLLKSMPKMESYFIPVRLDAAVRIPLPLLPFEGVDLFAPDGLDNLIFALQDAWKRKEVRRGSPDAG